MRIILLLVAANRGAIIRLRSALQGLAGLPWKQGRLLPHVGMPAARIV